jgi:hypothetical protein
MEAIRAHVEAAQCPLSDEGWAYVQQECGLQELPPHDRDSVLRFVLEVQLQLASQCSQFVLRPI